MSRIQLAPNTLAYQFESPGKYGMSTYVDNEDYDILEFNAYRDQPYHLCPEFKNVSLRKLKNLKRRIMISHVRERLNPDSKILRAHAVFIDWLVQSEICTAQQIVYVVGCQDEFDFLESYRQACNQESVLDIESTLLHTRILKLMLCGVCIKVISNWQTKNMTNYKTLLKTISYF